MTDDRDLERELARRALGGDWGLTEVRVDLHVGQFPPHPPAELPVLTPARTIGSVTRESRDPRYPSGATIYLDTPLTPVAARQQLDAAFGALGWTALPSHGDVTGGFELADVTRPLSMYRLDPDITATVSLTPAPDTTRVVFGVHRARDLRDQLQWAGVDLRPERALPLLRAPSGATVQPRGGSGGGRTIHMTAAIRTDLTLANLAGHYEAQLRHAGWTMTAQARHGATATSTWTFVLDDLPMLGVLAVREDRPGRYMGLFSTLEFT